MLVRQIRDFGFKGPIFIPGSSSSREVIAAAGAAGAEGVINVMYVDPANQAYKNFAAEYTKAPRETSTRLYLETMDEVLPKMEKTIVGADPKAVDLQFIKK